MARLAAIGHWSVRVNQQDSMLAFLANQRSRLAVSMRLRLVKQDCQKSGLSIAVTEVGIMAIGIMAIGIMAIAWAWNCCFEYRDYQ